MRSVKHSRYGLSLRQILSCLWIVGFGGCAYGNNGFILAKHTFTRTAEVVDIYSFGAQVRTIDYDRGATFGYRRASYVYPRVSEQSSQMSHIDIFHTVLPVTDPILLANTAIGVEVELIPETNRIAAGYLCQVLTIVPGGVNDSLIGRLSYSNNAPELTIAELASRDNSIKHDEN